MVHKKCNVVIDLGKSLYLPEEPGHPIVLLWDGVSFLELTAPSKFRSRLCGLCGNFNGDRTDDFYGRDGGFHPDGQSFGDTWRVGGDRACSVLPR